MHIGDSAVLCGLEVFKDPDAGVGADSNHEAVEVTKLTEKDYQPWKPTQRSELRGFVMLARQVTEMLPESAVRPPRISPMDELDHFPDEVDELNCRSEEENPARAVTEVETSGWHLSPESLLEMAKEILYCYKDVEESKRVISKLLQANSVSFVRDKDVTVKNLEAASTFQDGLIRVWWSLWKAQPFPHLLPYHSGYEGAER